MLSHIVNGVARALGLETKFDTTFALAYLHTLGRAVWSPKDYKTYCDEGYKKNAIVFRCVQLAAQHASRVRLCLHDANGDEIEDHPILKLLERPNPRQSGKKFFEALVGYYRISGNAFMYAVTVSGKITTESPQELWVLRPDRMTIVPGSKGIERYEYKVGGGEPVTFDVDPITGMSAVRHIKTFNPTDDLWGMSPIEAASYAVDQNNSAGAWNKALLDNGGKPSGAFVVGAQNGVSSGNLTDAQYERLRDRIDEQGTGPKNAGRPLILEGGLDWKEMGLSPRDMDWIEGRNASAREICQVFNTSPMMIGMPGDNTYANMGEARLSLYEDNVLPLCDEICDELNAWLVPMYPDLEGAKLKVDRDDVDALAPRRKEKWDTVSAATFLSINEKRKALDYEELPIPEADEVYIPSGLLPLRGSMDPPDTEETTPGSPKPSTPEADAAQAEDDMEKAMKAVRLALETKYSIDQERDERGRFSSGGGSGGGVSSKHARSGVPSAPQPQKFNDGFKRSEPAGVVNGRWSGSDESVASAESMTSALRSTGVDTVDIHPSVTEHLDTEGRRQLLGALMGANADQPMIGVGGRIRIAIDPNLPPNAQAVMHTRMAPVSEELSHTLAVGKAGMSGPSTAESGWFAVDGGLRDTINHEVAHARTSKELLFGTKKQRELTSTGKKIAMKVSTYAATNKVEFIAEAASGHLGGRVYDSDVHDLFTKYTGKSIADFTKGKP